MGILNPLRKISQSLKKDINGFLTSAFNSQMITETEWQFLTCKYPVRPVLYVLPKDTSQYPKTSDRQLCRISYGTFIGHYLRPIVAEQPSYLRDTSDFIDQLKSVKVDKNIKLVTLDVVSLYTNIPHFVGLAAMRHFFFRFKK